MMNCPKKIRAIKPGKHRVETEMQVAEDQSEKAAYCVILAILLSAKNQVLESLRLVIVRD